MAGEADLEQQRDDAQTGEQVEGRPDLRSHEPPLRVGRAQQDPEQEMPDEGRQREALRHALHDHGQGHREPDQQDLQSRDVFAAHALTSIEANDPGGCALRGLRSIVVGAAAGQGIPPPADDYSASPVYSTPSVHHSGAGAPLVKWSMKAFILSE